MTRGVGVGEWLASLPEWLVALTAVLTQLADLWFLTLVVATLYWLGPHTPWLGTAVDRRRMATVLGLLLLAIAATETLKAIVAVPRPPWAVAEPTPAWLAPTLAEGYAWLAGAEGYGFPSGHAIASTLTWGGLAWAVRAGRSRSRVAIAATVVTVVCLARLVLGVHYLVDVVAGVLVGLVALAVVLGSQRWRPALDATALAFGLATVLAILGLFVVGLSTDVAGGLGLPVGALAAWLAVGAAAIEDVGPRAARVTAILGVVLVLPPLGLAVVGPIPPAATLVVAVSAGACTVALPLVGRRVEKIV